MKGIKRTSAATLILFLTLSILTSKYESASDGIDEYGFPLTFYNHSSGKRDSYVEFGFKPYALLIDFGLIVSCFSIPILIIANIKKSK
ncbi:hypothetical protein NF867_06860 [Solitalea sp. MAHUQ-68]|uniref:Uncharacterized protein n=1 Tax=Solitalea agri TaxID=2953739 RepID=A0A9X2F1R8_9SPHI|nr:hypothetical protein [Solitalea agri]MCO4292575.1 hypothetical protein [Solitalea agri]